MNAMSLRGSIAASALALLGLGASAIAAPTGDATRGAEVTAACQGCHGARGEGVAATGGPRLAGQTAAYLASQLRNFTSGKRTSPIMTPIAKTLDEQKEADAAAFFAAQSPPFAAADAKPTDAQLARGKQLVRVGDEAKELQACANCHGPDGSGEPMATPYLAGQSAAYLANAIREWKTGARHSGEALMGTVASRLDESDIAAVSAYLESLGQEH